MPRVTRLSTRTRREGEQARRRALVLDAAEAVLRERGHAAATVDDVAERAGVSVGTVYNLVGSREDVRNAVVERIAQERVADTRRLVAGARGPAAGIRELAQSRLARFDRERLFFSLFSAERRTGGSCGSGDLPPTIVALYSEYMGLLAGLLQRGIDAGALTPLEPLHLALSFEGVLNAFMGYWTRPATPEGIPELAARFCETFLRLAGGHSETTPGAGSEGTSNQGPREVFITRFDADRLGELIAVARSFGGAALSRHLDELERELGRAQRVEPATVPRDVVTMNSLVRLRRFDTGAEEVRRLVFPADVGREPGSLSVLEPLGTAALGCRVGADIEVRDAATDAPVKCRIEALLYQPEAAGDYHL